MKGKYQMWLTLGISCLFVILPFVGYGASLTIGETVSVNGNLNATSFSGDGSGLTNVGGNSSCTPITSLPKIIATSGVYCLTSDLSASMSTGNAIEIQADDVVIELNGHKLDGLAAGPATSVLGVYAPQRKNITIRNGTVRGFWCGIVLDDLTPYTTSQGHIIENIRADMNTNLGIGVLGQGSIIRNNLVVKTGGSANEVNAFGIGVKGPGVRVLNNDIIETREKATGYAYAILIYEAPGAVVENNRIWNASLGDGTSVGIDISSSNKVLVINNRVTTMNYGIWYHFGSSSGKFRDNLTYDAPFPGINSGTDAGNNN